MEERRWRRASGGGGEQAEESRRRRSGGGDQAEESRRGRVNLGVSVQQDVALVRRSRAAWKLGDSHQRLKHVHVVCKGHLPCELLFIPVIPSGHVECIVGCCILFVNHCTGDEE